MERSSYLPDSMHRADPEKMRKQTKQALFTETPLNNGFLQEDDFVLLQRLKQREKSINQQSTSLKSMLIRLEGESEKNDENIVPASYHYKSTTRSSPHNSKKSNESILKSINNLQKSSPPILPADQDFLKSHLRVETPQPSRLSITDLVSTTQDSDIIATYEELNRIRERRERMTQDRVKKKLAMIETYERQQAEEEWRKIELQSIETAKLFYRQKFYKIFFWRLLSNAMQKKTFGVSLLVKSYLFRLSRGFRKLKFVSFSRKFRNSQMIIGSYQILFSKFRRRLEQRLMERAISTSQSFKALYFYQNYRLRRAMKEFYLIKSSRVFNRQYQRSELYFLKRCLRASYYRLMWCLKERLSRRKEHRLLLLKHYRKSRSCQLNELFFLKALKARVLQRNYVSRGNAYHLLRCVSVKVPVFDRLRRRLHYNSAASRAVIWFRFNKTRQFWRRFKYFQSCRSLLDMKVIKSGHDKHRSPLSRYLQRWMRLLINKKSYFEKHQRCVALVQRVSPSRTRKSLSALQGFPLYRLISRFVCLLKQFHRFQRSFLALRDRTMENRRQIQQVLSLRQEKSLKSFYRRLFSRVLFQRRLRRKSIGKREKRLRKAWMMWKKHLSLYGTLLDRSAAALAKSRGLCLGRGFLCWRNYLQIRRNSNSISSRLQSHWQSLKTRDSRWVLLYLLQERIIRKQRRLALIREMRSQIYSKLVLQSLRDWRVYLSQIRKRQTQYYQRGRALFSTRRLRDAWTVWRERSRQRVESRGDHRLRRFVVLVGRYWRRWQSFQQDRQERKNRIFVLTLFPHHQRRLSQHSREDLSLLKKDRSNRIFPDPLSLYYSHLMRRHWHVLLSYHHQRLRDGQQRRKGIDLNQRQCFLRLLNGCSTSLIRSGEQSSRYNLARSLHRQRSLSQSLTFWRDFLLKHRQQRSRGESARHWVKSQLMRGRGLRLWRNEVERRKELRREESSLLRRFHLKRYFTLFLLHNQRRVLPQKRQISATKFYFVRLSLLQSLQLWRDRVQEKKIDRSQTRAILFKFHSVQKIRLLESSFETLRQRLLKRIAVRERARLLTQTVQSRLLWRAFHHILGLLLSPTALTPLSPVRTSMNHSEYQENSRMGSGSVSRVSSRDFQKVDPSKGRNDAKNAKISPSSQSQLTEVTLKYFPTIDDQKKPLIGVKGQESSYTAQSLGVLSAEDRSPRVTFREAASFDQTERGTSVKRKDHNVSYSLRSLSVDSMDSFASSLFTVMTSEGGGQVRNGFQQLNQAIRYFKDKKSRESLHRLYGYSCSQRKLRQNLHRFLTRRALRRWRKRPFQRTSWLLTAQKSDRFHQLRQIFRIFRRWRVVLVSQQRFLLSEGTEGKSTSLRLKASSLASSLVRQKKKQSFVAHLLLWRRQIYRVYFLKRWRGVLLQRLRMQRQLILEKSDGFYRRWQMMRSLASWRDHRFFRTEAASSSLQIATEHCQRYSLRRSVKFWLFSLLRTRQLQREKELFHCKQKQLSLWKWKRKVFGLKACGLEMIMHPFPSVISSAAKGSLRARPSLLLSALYGGDRVFPLDCFTAQRRIMRDSKKDLSREMMRRRLAISEEYDKRKVLMKSISTWRGETKIAKRESLLNLAVQEHHSIFHSLRVIRVWCNQTRCHLQEQRQLRKARAGHFQKVMRSALSLWKRKNTLKQCFLLLRQKTLSSPFFNKWRFKVSARRKLRRFLVTVIPIFHRRLLMTFLSDWKYSTFLERRITSFLSLRSQKKREDAWNSLQNFRRRQRKRRQSIILATTFSYERRVSFFLKHLVLMQKMHRVSKRCSQLALQQYDSFQKLSTLRHLHYWKRIRRAFLFYRRQSFLRLIDCLRRNRWFYQQYLNQHLLRKVRDFRLSKGWRKWRSFTTSRLSGKHWLHQRNRSRFFRILQTKSWILKDKDKETSSTLKPWTESRETEKLSRFLQSRGLKRSSSFDGVLKEPTRISPTIIEQDKERNKSKSKFYGQQDLKFIMFYDQYAFKQRLFHFFRTWQLNIQQKRKMLHYYSWFSNYHRMQHQLRKSFHHLLQHRTCKIRRQRNLAVLQLLSQQLMIRRFFRMLLLSSLQRWKMQQEERLCLASSRQKQLRRAILAWKKLSSIREVTQAHEIPCIPSAETPSIW